jgi:hypothetical protein
MCVSYGDRGCLTRTHFWLDARLLITFNGGILHGLLLVLVWAHCRLPWNTAHWTAPTVASLGDNQGYILTNCPGIAHPASTPAGARQAVYYSPACKQDYETPYMPSGLLWRFVLHENWNDGYYIGLDGLVFLDAQGRPIDVLGVSSGAGAEVHAVPHSLRDLADAHARSAEGSAAADPNDPRTPDKLFADPQGNNFVGWLAPLSRCMSTEERSQCAARLHSRNASTSRLQEEENAGHKFPLDNTVLVCFQYPVSISGIIIKNYSKTPARGVK